MEIPVQSESLNVAVSRARCLAVLVARPALLRIRCRSAEQMRLVNALCRLVEVAAQQTDRRTRDRRNGGVARGDVPLVVVHVLNPLLLSCAGSASRPPAV